MVSRPGTPSATPMLTMRVSDEEMERIQRVASRRGLTVAGVIRSWLQRDERALGIRQRQQPDAATLFTAAHRIYDRFLIGAGIPGAREGQRIPGAVADPEQSGFDIDDGQRLYFLRTKTMELARFRVLKNGGLRMLPQ